LKALGPLAWFISISQHLNSALQKQLP
jgi:hypothetical protein